MLTCLNVFHFSTVEIKCNFTFTATQKLHLENINNIIFKINPHNILARLYISIYLYFKKHFLFVFISTLIFYFKFSLVSDSYQSFAHFSFYCLEMFFFVLVLRLAF